MRGTRSRLEGSRRIVKRDSGRLKFILAEWEVQLGVTLASGPAEIVGQGMATTFEGSPLLLALADGTSGKFVYMTFPMDENAPPDDARIARFDDRLDVEMVNFRNLDGRGTATPLWLGDWDDRRYYIHFRVFRFGNTEDVTVHYTFFRVNATEGGEASP